MAQTNNKNVEDEIIITRTRWMNNSRNTILLTIPHQFRKRYRLNEQTSVLMIPTNKGILFKKLEMEEIE